jgi:hypothetical protein
MPDALNLGDNTAKALGMAEFAGYLPELQEV